MIYHDRVTVICRSRTGGEVVERFNGPVPATMAPLPANQFQLVLKPFAYLIPVNAASAVTNRDGDNQILFAWDPYTHLTPDGPIVRHYLRGRLHHYEAVLRAP